MSFGLSSSDLLEFRRLQNVVCASNIVGPSNIYQGQPGPPGPTGPPGPVNYMNGGYEYLYNPQKDGIPNGYFSFSPGNNILDAKQIQISMMSENGSYLGDYFLQIPVGSRLFIYNRLNTVTHAFVIHSHVRYSGLYIFEVSLTTSISYIPVTKEPYVISFSLRGPPGEGIPGGGIEGQVITKRSSNDYDTIWSSPLPYIARGRIPNTCDIAYSILDATKKWTGSNYICKLTGTDMSNLTLSGDPSVFINGIFTGQQQWTITFNATANTTISKQYAILPPSYIGTVCSDGSTPFYIISAGSNIVPVGSGTSWILWNI